MNVKTPVTRMYGVSRPNITKPVPNGSYCEIVLIAEVFAKAAMSPKAATMRAGPTTMTLRYSLNRRPKLRGCSTRHTKLKLSSTFCTIDMTV